MPFTSERQLTGAGPAEPTATIVQRVLAELGVTHEVLLWNVVPTHPGTQRSDRRPSRAEVDGGPPVRRAPERGRRVIAVGRLAESARRSAVRPPPLARRRAASLSPAARVLCGDACYNPPRRTPCPPLFCHEDLERKAGRDRAPTGTSSTPRGRPSAVSRRRSPTRCAARASRSTRRTSTRATSSSSSTRRRSRSPARSSTRSCTTGTRAIRAAQGADAARAARRAPDGGAAQGRQGHAPPEPPGRAQITQAQDLRGPRASARGAGAEAPRTGELDVTARSVSRAPASARPRSRA